MYESAKLRNSFIITPVQTRLEDKPTHIKAEHLVKMGADGFLPNGGSFDLLVLELAP